MRNIGVVLTAGAKTRAWIFGTVPLPVLFFTWPPAKKLYPTLGIRIELIDELKEETEWRLKKACDLYRNQVIDTVFLAGGHSDHRKRDSAAMSREWLIRHGIPESDIFSENDSVDTESNIRGLADFVRNIGYPVVITVITSHYHAKRAGATVRRLLPKGTAIRSIKVFPPITWECLRREYLYNLLSEPLKRLITRFPALLTISERSERKVRKSYTEKTATK
ncbi:MAG: YdcF family protein [Candidatus Moranbacteria bacterium]|nr:YdcF family protein [Candidatus Moranbacteria bacterium]NTW46431.1 YdcF family protein [Candidatus Moranbacteria bacterium]